jgi:RNA polymerase sigma-70 factor (ECF subfamily)
MGYIRTCINWLHKKKIKTVDVEEVYTKEVQFDARILQDLSVQELYTLIHHLPNKYKEVFNLHVIDGYSHEEIGEFLGIKTVSSRTRLHRAKEILRKKIERIKKQESCVITT